MVMEIGVYWNRKKKVDHSLWPAQWWFRKTFGFGLAGLVTVGWNVVLQQGLQVFQCTELGAAGDGQEVGLNCGRVSQEDLNTIFAGDLVFREFKQSSNAVVRELWLPDVECGEDVCNCRVVTGEQHNLCLELVGDFLLPIGDRLFDEHAPLESLQFGVVSSVNVTQVGHALQLSGEVILGPFWECQAVLLL